MELFLVYLWLKLDGLHVALWVLIPALLLARMAFTISKGDLSREGQKEFDLIYGLRRKFLLPLASICIILAVFLPTSKDVAILVGTSYAMSISKSPEGEKVMTLIRKKANEYLDEQLTPKKVVEHK